MHWNRSHVRPDYVYHLENSLPDPIEQLDGMLHSMCMVASCYVTCLCYHYMACGEEIERTFLLMEFPSSAWFHTQHAKDRRLKIAVRAYS